MRAPADFTYSIPDGLASADAAPLLCAGITVYSPLRRKLKAPGMKVAVMGVGGLGHLALQFAAAMGTQVRGCRYCRCRWLQRWCCWVLLLRPAALRAIGGMVSTTAHYPVAMHEQYSLLRALPPRLRPPPWRRHA